MNKITVVNDMIVDTSLDASIHVEVTLKCHFRAVNQIKLNIKEDTRLELNYSSNEPTLLDVFIQVEPNVSFDLFEQRTGMDSKVQYKYCLAEGSSTRVVKFNHCDGIKELDVVDLNGIGAKFDYILKTISTHREKYDMMVYHNAKKTESNIINHGVTVNAGVIAIHVTGIVENGVTGCLINQKNRIVTNNRKGCEICPNLLIEENDVEANHAAYIGAFSDEEIFYLQSRGIDIDTAHNLLIRGFLLSELEVSEEKKKELQTFIDAYWR